MDQVTICNMALGYLGDLTKKKRLTAFTRVAAGDNAVHHALIDFYDTAKEQMHAMMDFKRARKVKPLSVVNATPVLSGKWSYKYARPPDCFILRKIVDISFNEYEWDEVNEERTADGQTFNDEYIYCNQGDVYGWYTILIGEDRYMPGMAQLHAMILAEAIAMTATGNAVAAMTATQKLHSRMETLCLGLAAGEGYVENEKGENRLTSLY